jgi:hypothetical protein
MPKFFRVQRSFNDGRLTLCAATVPAEVTIDPQKERYDDESIPANHLVDDGCVEDD